MEDEMEDGMEDEMENRQSYLTPVYKYSGFYTTYTCATRFSGFGLEFRHSVNVSTSSHRYFIVGALVAHWGTRCTINVCISFLGLRKKFFIRYGVQGLWSYPDNNAQQTGYNAPNHVKIGHNWREEIEHLKGEQPGAGRLAGLASRCCVQYQIFTKATLCDAKIFESSITISIFRYKTPESRIGAAPCTHQCGGGGGKSLRHPLNKGDFENCALHK